VEYNTERPHSALGYRPPAPQAILPKHRGMEMWKTFGVSHILTPPAAATDKCLTMMAPVILNQEEPESLTVARYRASHY